MTEATRAAPMRRPGPSPTHRVPARLALYLAALALTAGCGDDPAAGPADTSAPPDAVTPSDAEVTSPDAVGPDLIDPDALALVQVLPSEGRTSGLEEVSLVGRGLSRVVEVFFGDAKALDPFAVTDSLLVALTPPHVRGLVDVTIVDDLGARVTLPMAFTFIEPVQVIGVEPATGSTLGGDRVLVHGAGFDRDAVVIVGGRRAVTTRFIAAHTLEIVTPEGTAGPADVLVTSEAGSGRLRRGFEYLPTVLPQGAMRVDRVSPALGPAAGGTRVVIEGSGFSSGVAVRIGALPATQVTVDSASRITATTPPGSPGRATVRLLASGTMAELAGGFLYQSEPAVWAVDPPTGSTAGGTRVRLLGAGFPSQVEVRFGDKLASAVSVVSETEILATTPNNTVGPIAVSVRSSQLPAPLVRPGAFVYFDPAANPGTWGEPIDGAVNITVQNARSGARIKGAFVMLGGSTATSYRGYTNDEGQVTFSGPDLIGDQTVTASFTGHQTFQLAGFDAENVTIPLEKAWTCEDIADMPCDSWTEPPPTATVEVQIVGSNKGPTVPFGACADWSDAPGGLCRACASDADCRGDIAPGVGGGFCRELGPEGTFCTTGCATNADCGSGFVCLDPTGLELEKRCVPPPGTPTTYCDITESNLFAPVAIHYPGVWVPSTDRVQITSRLGDFAVFCWDGVDVRGNFRPHALGVARGLGAYRDREQVTAEVRIDIPLGRKVTIEVDRPTFVPVSQAMRNELTNLRVGLDLGGDGVIEFPPQLAFAPRSFLLDVPSISSSQLHDARWEIYAEVTVSSLNGGSAAHEQGLTRLDHELDYVHDEDGWRPVVSPMAVTRGLAVWREADGRRSLIAVGDEGRILKRFASTWAIMPTDLGGSARDLLSVAVARGDETAPTTRAIAGGKAGLALHWNGLRWEARPTGVLGPVSAVSFGDEEVAFAVAGREVLRWDGASWSPVARADRELLATWAVSADEAWVAGEGGFIGRLTRADPSDPFLLSATPSGFGGTWRALLAHGPELFAAGELGAIARWDGATWHLEATDAEHDLFALGLDDGALVAVGARGTKLRRTPDAGWTLESHGHHRGTLRAVARDDAGLWAMGSHELVLGPLLGIPENLTPPPGGFVSRLGWQAKTGLDAHFSVLEIGAETGPCSACGMLFMLPYTGWRSVLDGDLFAADFPALRGIANTATPINGVRGLTLYRVRTEDGFDFDHTATSGFFGGRWKAWAWRTEAFIF